MSGTARLGFKERQAAQALEFCAVYVVRPASPPPGLHPLRIAIAANIEKRIADVQAFNWQALEVAHVVWFDGKLLADRVGHMAESYLSRDAKRLRGDWFDAKAELAINLIEKAALTLNIRWFDESERRRRLKAEVEARLVIAAQRLLGRL